MIASLFIFGCKKDDDALASETADEYVGTYNAKVLNDGNEGVLTITKSSNDLVVDFKENSGPNSSYELNFNLKGTYRKDRGDFQFETCSDCLSSVENYDLIEGYIEKLTIDDESQITLYLDTEYPDTILNTVSTAKMSFVIETD